MNTLSRFVNKLFPAAIGSQRNIKNDVQNAIIEITLICDKLNKIIILIALEAVNINSSMEPNNISDTCFNTKLDVFTKCFSSVAEI